jgi:hypothetical protein
MSVLMVAEIPGLVVDKAFEGRRAAAGSVLHGAEVFEAVKIPVS